MKLLLAIFLLAAPVARASEFMDWIGSYHNTESPWSVTVREDKPPQFAYKGDWGLVSSTAVSPEGWLPHKGWFVCIEDKSRLWAFDGGKELLLVEVKKEGSTLYGLETLPAPPPRDVIERLPDSIRKKLTARFNK
jgi:hypothetical protein